MAGIPEDEALWPERYASAAGASASARSSSAPWWSNWQANWTTQVEPHLEELRRRLWASVAGTLLAVAGSFWAAPSVIAWLEQLAPSSTRFIQLVPGEALWVTVKTAVLLGIALALPWLLYQLGCFVFPGLTAKERRLLLLAVLAGGGLFLAGVVFAATLLLPATLALLLTYGQQLASHDIALSKFMDFCLFLLLVVGIAFEAPLLILLLSRLGWINPVTLQARWREMAVTVFLVAAVLTPSQDPFTMGMLATALFVLVWGSLAVARWLQ